MNSYFRRKRERFIWLFFLTALLFIYLTYNLVKLQAKEHDFMSKKARFMHVGSMKINALRGSIFDRNGNCLAQSLALSSVAANPKQIKNKEQTALFLSAALGKKESDILYLLNAPGTFIWIARKVKPEIAEKIKAMKLPGVFFIDEPSGRRFHPKKGIACHIVGFTGIDDQGLEGVEASYDELLGGKNGSLKAEMDERGRVLPMGKTIFKPPVPGKDLYLTIDETIQFIVERELRKAVKKFNAASGEIIIYDPKNGDILALANYPNYNPEKSYKATKTQLRNKAVCDNYEPGSTFKAILGAIALESGKATPTDQFYSGNSIQIGGYSLRNASDGLYSPTGYETIEGVITYSFNTGAASIGLRVGKKTFYEYLVKLGFGQLTGIDLPGEAEGIMAHEKYWKPINLATISYGQGISVTPIQMVRAYGALCNDGCMMKPRVVRKIVNHDGTIYRSTKPKKSIKIFKAKTCHEILKALASVCREGTAKKAKIPGYTVGGKTGTANVVRNGVYLADKHIASFIGVVPVEDPKLVMLVRIDEPVGQMAWGGTMAAPLFNKIGSQILWRLGIYPNKQQNLSQIIKESDKKPEGE